MAALKNAKWERYAQGLAAGKLQLDAYAEAGYTRPTDAAASKLANKSQVAERKAEILELAASEAGVTTEWILAKLKENADRCMQAEPVTDSDGAHTGFWKWEPQAANKALELLGKNTGAWAADNNQRKPEPSVATVIMYPDNGRDK